MTAAEADSRVRVAVRRVEGDELLLTLREEVGEVWAETMPASPERLHERLYDFLPRHAEREDFRCTAAFERGGRLAGFGYGYRGAPGQWWHDRVAAAFGRELAGRWLPPGHFELVELHVRPAFQSRGIGGRIHDDLFEGLRAPTAVLSTQRDNERAIRFYERRGWRIVLDRIDFGPGYSPFVVMGRDLARGSTMR